MSGVGQYFTLDYWKEHKTLGYVLIAVAVVVVLSLVFGLTFGLKSNYAEAPPGFERFVGNYENLEDKSWNDVAKGMAVDSSVEKSHREFVDAQNMISNAAALTVREPVDDIQFVGLRRPDYSVPISDHARSQSSAYQEDLPSYRRMLI